VEVNNEWSRSGAELRFLECLAVGRRSRETVGPADLLGCLDWGALGTSLPRARKDNVRGAADRMSQIAVSQPTRRKVIPLGTT